MTTPRDPPRASDARLPGLRAWVGDGALLLLACVVLGLVIGHISLRSSDFNAFYASAMARRAGVVDLQRNFNFPDLNPPTFGVLLIPLTWFSMDTAFWIWTLLGFCSLAATLVLTRKARPVGSRRMVWAAASAGLLMPSLAIWILGQVTWVLAYPLTRAWCARSRVRSGIWLGGLIAVKPPLALMAILLPWPVPGVAALVSAAICGASIAWTGWQPWLEWLRTSARVDWIGGTLNGSLWAWAARLQSGAIVPTHLVDLNAYAIILVLVVGAVLVVPVIGARGDRRWLLAFWWSVLLSPLGWVYYLPMAIGPTLATWRWNVWSLCAAVLFLIPLPALSRALPWNTASALAINSTYAIALLLAWIAWMRPLPASARDQSDL